MKTRCLLLMIFAGLFSISAIAQNQKVVADEYSTPKPHSFAPTDLISVTSDDNENNALAGIADNDLDVYLRRNDLEAPIEFNIFIDDNPVNLAQLSILAWDVDWVGHSGFLGELDRVYVNGHSIGYLTGANEEWSTSVFYIDPSFINPGPGGKNLITIDIDERGEGWAVNVDWGQLVINGAAGVAEFRYVTLDKYAYNAGEYVHITEEVDAEPTLYVRVETNLLDPQNQIIAGTDRELWATIGDESFTENLIIPATAPDGFYQVMAILYDVGTNVQQDIEYVPFIVGNPCVDPSVDAGIDEQIYIGYPPYSAHLNAVGSGPGTYSWSPVAGLDDPNIADPIAMPETTTVYTVTFTDDFGCTATDDITVNVMDVRCGKKMNKVLVCHIPPGNPENAHTICIAFPAVQAHLDHGDYLGACLGDKVLDVTNMPEDISLKVFPNPMENNCNIEIELNIATPVEIYITDITGKKIASIFKGELGAGHYDYSWDNMNVERKGIYFLSVITNTETFTQKLLVK